MWNEIKRYAFLVECLALAILYFMWDRRGREIKELVEDAQRAKLGVKLKSIQDQVASTEKESSNAQKSYQDLVNLHGDLLAKLGIRPATAESKPAGNDPAN